MAIVRKDQTPVKAASLKPSDFVRELDVEQERDVVAELGEFFNEAAREDRFPLSGFPVHVIRQLDVFGSSTTPRRKKVDAFPFALREGLALLAHLPGIKSIRTSRDVVLAAGADDADTLDFFDRFRFEVAAPEGRSKKWFRRVAPDDREQCARLASALGLPIVTVAALAVMFILISVPRVPDAKKQAMYDQLVDFGRRLRARAERAAMLRDHALRAAVPATRCFSAADVLDALKE